jgi:Co/Zn/Cd efflux system component
MAMEGGKKVQAIKITEDCSMNTMNVVQHLPTSHCHVPDEKFNYGARNRLIVVLILSFVFMIIEIVGTCLCSKFN